MGAGGPAEGWWSHPVEATGISSRMKIHVMAKVCAISVAPGRNGSVDGNPVETECPATVEPHMRL